jgi:hypothetical protein
MDLRRTPTGQTEWYVARPGFWEVAVQPLEEFPSETENHPALHTVAGYAVLAEDKDKVPVTGRFTLDFGDGEFKLYRPLAATRSAWCASSRTLGDTMRRRHFAAAIAFLLGALVAVAVSGAEGYSLHLLWWPVGFALAVYLFPVSGWFVMPDVMFGDWLNRRKDKGKKE